MTQELSFQHNDLTTTEAETETETVVGDGERGDKAQKGDDSPPSYSSSLATGGRKLPVMGTPEWWAAMGLEAATIVEESGDELLLEFCE